MKLLEGRQGIAVLVVGLMLGFYLYKRKPGPSANQPTKATGQAESPTEQRPGQEMIDSLAPKVKVEQIVEERRQSNLRIEAGLQSIPTVSTGSGLKFLTRFKTVPMGCAMGDFDFIKSMTDSYSDKIFLLSFEPLHSNKSEIIRFRVSLGDIASPRPLEVVVPKVPDAARDYAVYLCLDTAKTNECGKKKTIGPRFWAGALNKKKDRDGVLYFQALTVRNEAAYILPSKHWNDSAVKSLKKTLKSTLESEATLDHMQKKLLDLSSAPARVSQNALNLTLPYKHPNCD